MFFSLIYSTPHLDGFLNTKAKEVNVFSKPKTQKEPKVTKKKSSGTRGTEALKKVNTKGMKNISSFFGSKK